MADTTSKSLLAKVHGGDETSWDKFYDAYRPLILRAAHKLDLNSAEQNELVQAVMLEVFNKDIAGKFETDTIPENVTFVHDPSKGRFRHYMRRIAHFQALKIIRKRKSAVSLDNAAVSSKIAPTVEEWDEIWDKEWQKHVLNMAMVELRGRVKPETYVAFEMYAIQNRKVEDVADFLNLSVSSVYTAKSRCITTLREIIKDLEEK